MRLQRLATVSAQSLNRQVSHPSPANAASAIEAGTRWARRTAAHGLSNQCLTRIVRVRSNAEFRYFGRQVLLVESTKSRSVRGICSFAATFPVASFFFSPFVQPLDYTPAPPSRTKVGFWVPLHPVTVRVYTRVITSSRAKGNAARTGDVTVSGFTPRGHVTRNRGPGSSDNVSQCQPVPP